MSSRQPRRRAAARNKEKMLAMKKYLLCMALMLGVAGSLPAQEPADSLAGAAAPQSQPEAVAAEAAAALTEAQLWDKANTAYINSDYHKAIDVYEQILARGLGSPKLYYNLGNAYFKEERLGKAILNYNRALRLAPGNDDIRYNLSVAEAMTKDNIEDIPEFFLVSWLRAVRHTMGCTSWSILSLVALLCMLGLFLLYLLSQRLSLRKAGFYGTLVAFLLFVVTMWFAVAERHEILDDSQAVVMASAAAVKSSPDTSSTDLFVLHEGTTLTITDRLGTWCEVVIADGKKGWLESSKIEVI